MVGKRGCFKMRTDKVLQFVVDFHRMQFAAHHAFGKTKCRIARERAQFQYILRTNHPHEHLQQLALKVSGTHARTQVEEMRFAVEPPEHLPFFVNMREYVFFEFFCHYFVSGCSKLGRS